MRIAVLACLLALAPARLRAQATPTPEEASAQLAQQIRELSSPTAGKAIRDALGTYQQAQKERVKRDLAPRAAKDTTPANSPFSLGRNSAMDPMYRQSLRFNTESVDLNLLRPSKRLILGAGVAERSMSDHGTTIYDKNEAYGFIKLRLGAKDEKSAKFALPPTATYTELELGPNKVRVDSEEHDRGLKELKP
jgi:hypothetical protein